MTISWLKNKKGSLLHKVLIHIVLVGLLFLVLMSAMELKFGSRGVKQQVLEKELAILIDAAEPGMSFYLKKNNPNGFVNDVKISDGRIFVGVDDFLFSDGYPYFSRYKVSVSEDDSKFVVSVDE